MYQFYHQKFSARWFLNWLYGTLGSILDRPVVFFCVLSFIERKCGKRSFRMIGFHLNAMLGKKTIETYHVFEFSVRFIGEIIEVIKSEVGGGGNELGRILR